MFSRHQQEHKNYSLSLSRAILGFANSNQRKLEQKYLGGDFSPPYFAARSILQEQFDNYSKGDYQPGSYLHKDRYVGLLMSVIDMLTSLTRDNKLLGVANSIWEEKGLRTHCLVDLRSSKTEEITPYQFLIRTILLKVSPEGSNQINDLASRFSKDYQLIKSQSAKIAKFGSDERPDMVKNIITQTQSDLFTLDKPSPSTSPSSLKTLSGFENSPSYVVT
jgi:hypothetical protein